MKLFIIGVCISLSSMASSRNCQERVIQDYIAATPGYEYHSLSNEVMRILKNEKSFTAYGKKFEIDYAFDVEVYFGSNEYMSGYGVDALIVEPTTCETLKIVNVYTE